MKYLSKFAVASIVGASILGSSYAAAPTGGYAPGETLEPDCAPNETDCHIKFQTRLSDKDGDTYVETEAAADQDYLRFYTKGVDMFTITNAASYSRKPLIGQSYVRSQINRADTSNGSNGITGQLILDGKHGTKYARWDLHNWNDHGTPKYNGLAFYKYIDKNGDGDGSDAGESGIGMFLDNDSRLGIATAAPTERLDVNGDARVRGHLHANNRIINNHSSPTYDVWIQGGGETATGSARNLAILGYDEDSGDYLRINHGNEYKNGVRIDGKVRVNELCDSAGTSCQSITSVLAGGGAFHDPDSWIRSNVGDKPLYLNKKIRSDEALEVGPGGGVDADKSGVLIKRDGDIQASNANGGHIKASSIDGGIEIGSGNDEYSYIDFKGKSELGEDYSGRFAYDNSKSWFRMYDKDSSGYLIHKPHDGALEIGSGNDATAYIDFKGNNQLSDDFGGRIAYSATSDRIKVEGAAYTELNSGIVTNHPSNTYDLWIQGGASSASGDDRNLALLGFDEDSGDYLRINHNNEYANGVQVQGKLRVNEICKADATGCINVANIGTGSGGAFHTPDSWIRSNVGDKPLYLKEKIRTDTNLQVGPNGDNFFADRAGTIVGKNSNGGSFAANSAGGWVHVKSGDDNAAHIHFWGKNQLNSSASGAHIRYNSDADVVSVEGADFHVNKYIYGVSSDAKKSVELRMNDGGIRLKRDTTANAGNTNGYIDFASEHEPSTYGRLQYNDRANVFAFGTAGANGGHAYIRANSGAIELGSGDNAYSYIDFKGNDQLADDFGGRILYSSVSDRMKVEGVGYTELKSGVMADHPSTTYDIWLQGGASASGGDNRNLALLGVDEDSGDFLVINHGGEYANGTRVDGKLRVNQICKTDGTGCVWTDNIGTPSCTTVTKTATPSQNNGKASVSCPSGRAATGGGVSCGSGNGQIIYSRPKLSGSTPVGWEGDCHGFNYYPQSQDVNTTVYAICCK